MAAETYTLSDFLRAEISRRKMSIREFARFLDVNHQTINKFLEYGKQDVGYPSVDFILKLSKATNTDVGTIMSFIDPTVPTVPSGDFSPEARVLASQLEQLSDHDRKMVELFVQAIIERGDK